MGDKIVSKEQRIIKHLKRAIELRSIDGIAPIRGRFIVGSQTLFEIMLIDNYACGIFPLRGMSVFGYPVVVILDKPEDWLYFEVDNAQ